MIGLVVGGVGAWFGTRLLGSMLSQVKPADPVTLGGVAVVMLLVAGVAAALPAWRATRRSPAEALNAE